MALKQAKLIQSVAPYDPALFGNNARNSLTDQYQLTAEGQKLLTQLRPNLSLRIWGWVRTFPPLLQVVGNTLGTLALVGTVSGGVWWLIKSLLAASA